MKRALFALILAVALFACGAASADSRWIGITPGARTSDAAVDLVSTDVDATVFTVNVPGVRLERAVNNRSRAFVRVTVPGSGVTGRVGEPALPVLRTLVRVPFGAEAEVEVTGARFRTIDLAKEGYGLEVWPQQPPIEKTPGARQRAAFVRDGAAYSVAEYRDELATIEGAGVLRGMRYVSVAISPVAYAPRRGVLRVATDFTITLTTPAAGRGGRSFTRRAALADPSFADLGADLFLNGRAVAGRTKELPAVPTGYLVITNNAYASDPAVQDLALHRTERGYDVTIASTNTIGNTKEQIKSYIQTAYDTWPRPPAFVLLVGDTNVIPNWIGGGEGSPGTDLNYSCLEGADYFADLFLGRLSVSSATELANVVNKTLSLEGLDQTPYDWVREATFLASTDNYTITEGTHNYVIETFLDPAGFTAYKRYTVTYDATAAQVTSDINGGVSEVTYSGHGDVTYWADGPEYHQAEVRALTNTVYPFVQSYACLTGQFESSECFGETWIRGAHGGVAFMGSSVNSYWDEDDILERVLYESYFDNPDGDNLTWLAGMMNRGKAGVFEAYGLTPTVQRYFEMYNLLGDPAIDLPNGAPAALAPEYSPVLFMGATEITVGTGVPGAVAAVSKGGVLHGAGRAGAGGSAVVTFDEPIAEAGSYTLVVWAHNHVPFRTQITAQAASSDGAVTLDRAIYGGHDTVNVLLADVDLAGNGTQEVVAKSDTTPAGVTVTLTELGDTGAFSGSFDTTSGKAGLPVTDGDTITVVYTDADDGAGHHNVPKTATALVDAAGPEFAGLASAVGGDQEVTLEWAAAVDPSTPVTYSIYRANTSGGQDFGAPIATTQGLGYVDTGLQNFTTYYYIVRAADALGNAEDNTVERPGRPTGPVAIWIETFEDKAISDWLREDLNADGTTWTDANPYGRASAFLDTTFAVCDNTGFLNQSNDAMTGPVVDATGYVDLDLRYGQSFLKEALMGNPETGTVQVTGGSGWETVGTVQETLEGEVRVDLAASYDETAAFQVKFAYQNTSLFSDGFWGVDNVALYGMPSGPPQAAFSGTPRSGPAPLEVSFINETMGIYETCAWDFGDGQAGEGDAPIHVFAEPGLYTVSMTVTGPGGEDTETQEGYIEVTAEGDDTDDDTGPADDDDSGGDDDDDNDDDGCGC